MGTGIKIVKKQDEHYCYSDINQEAWLLGTDIMSLMWGIMNILIFLIICREYKRQVIVSMSAWNLHNKPRHITPYKPLTFRHGNLTHNCKPIICKYVKYNFICNLIIGTVV